MLPSSASNSSQSSFESPISQHPHAWFPSIPRRREPPKYPRYYATPLKEDIPDSTPLQLYGLEPREPSIAEKRGRFQRFSRALDDIREDITLQLEPQALADRAKVRRRMSTFLPETSSTPSLPSARPGSSASFSGSMFASSPSGLDSPSEEDHPASGSRPLSMIFSPDAWTPPVRRLSRRLSVLSFSQKRHRYRGGGAPSISQPNLISSSTPI
ncbi:hypothetical protein P175DRAFT_0500424 [Aspergillus ochraceoroseus IBT 24754]|uniref:Uncharacterized protein n=3 Tax=Aspergillus subgen. Nidulantes TaxID=2720870 RepID=A0A0F8XBG4_9EURO|nr:uncharacterized protein P175DRAFT_0500424 [Aspergillus ochraceoroseus IBT 24754]KKK18583.1 hypothetical protein AOCH_006403 [Aspergillus ochraceoroseus]KKK20957.1 hypothetical protein ARAM_006425 [Aspergillus rambellii]PTU21532.1 hypothetical protein P175DRAFT_0500424 [Aspergillus ochraceoroseus IBT 24754]